jgi:uncharacterized repeat protein (TIGR01451 family)
LKQFVHGALLVCLLCVSLLVPSAVSTTQAAKSKPSVVGNYDIRVLGTEQLADLLAVYAPSVRQDRVRLAKDQAAQMQQAAVRLQRALPGADVRFSDLFGAAELVRNSGGTLTGPAPGRDAALIAKDFLRTNQALYGLNDSEVNALQFLGESLSPANGLRMVRFEQQVDGLPVFQSDSRFIVTADGRLVRSVGLLVPSLSKAAVPLGTVISADDALVAAMDSVGITLNANAAQLRNVADDARRAEVLIADPRISDAVVSELVYFPLAPGVLVPAWSQVTYTAGSGDWYTLVDARTGTLLWRKNIRSAPVLAQDQSALAPLANAVAPSAAKSVSVQRQAEPAALPAVPNAVTQDARFSVYVQADGKTPSIPAPSTPVMIGVGSGTQFPAISRTIVSMSAVQDLTASPNGWIPDDVTTTTGNNVDAYLDIASDNVPDNNFLDANGRPTGNPDTNGRNRDFLGAAPRNFEYTPAPLVNNPDAGDAPSSTSFRRGVVTQLFYVTNWFHDQLYQLGFDEAAGNFQQDNFGRGGLGNDRVLAEAQDGGGTDNANFSTPPDGQPGRMQMYIFTGSNPDRDGSLDAEIVVHELAHGLSNRLVGNGDGLIWDIGGAMGEGWSDFYALSLLNNKATDDPDGVYTVGAYATYKLEPTFTDNYLYAIRRFPYTTDNSINPLTWADVDDTTFNPSGGITQSPATGNDSGALQVHSAGEIWALTLWEVRSRIIADPAGANGNVAIGNRTMLQLTTDAMKLTPMNPSFIDARDALIDADCATNACANERWIWEGFADRGLGYDAVAPLAQGGLMGIGGHLGVGESYAAPAPAVASVAIDDSAGNANGAIDPGEPISLAVTVKNPWRNTSIQASNVQATLSSATPGVTINTNSANYGTLAAQASASRNFSFTLDGAASCGQSLKFTLQLTSSLGTVSREFVLRIGQASGTGTPVVYTRTIAGGLNIPDGNGAGITDNFTIRDDLEIADLNFRLDSLTHTWTGDIGLMLKGPNGYGTELIHHRGVFFEDGNLSNGDNFINTVIDDEATADLNDTVPSQAPFTGSWKPAFNSPIWNEFDIPGFGPDPIGHLSRFDGMSTQGVWQVHVNDIYDLDTGKLNAWSLIVTPTAFTCSAYIPGANLSATKTVSGGTAVGDTVSYQVNITNNGTTAQADNAGNEFTDVLPAQLTLLSASADSGTATATLGTNTVTWNGAIAVGGVVQITITAQINAGAEGATVSNQGTLSFDSDNNGSNDASGVTDNPNTAAVNDPTSFVVDSVAPTGANLSATKTVSGGTAAGDTVSYQINITNNGTAAQADNAGNEFTDILPAQLTLLSASADSGTATTNIGTRTVTWNGTIAVGGVVQITITAQINAGTAGATVSNQGTLSFDSDNNGSNDASGVTDDPNTVAVNDPTSFVVDSVVPTGANLSATKTVSGGTAVGDTVSYQINITNNGTAAQADNAGNEFTDILPAQLTLLSASADSGTATTNIGTRTVTWNGAIAVGGVVQITITAQINAGTAGATVSNQGTLSFDSDNNGSNDASGVTDNPNTAAANDPTSFVVDALAGTPSIMAIQTAILATDVNGDGKVNPGDVLLYTVVLNNIGTGDGLAIVLNSGLDANTSLEIGSVSTTLGTVSDGNNVGSTSAVVTLPTLPAGASATISFKAKVRSPLSPSISQVTSQARITGSNFAPILSDDPSSVALNDPTVTLIQVPYLIHLPMVRR